MSGSNVLTAQTSSTGTIVSHDCRLLGFTVSFSTAGDPTLSFRDTTGTTGSTLAIYKFELAAGGPDVTKHIRLPEAGIYFKEGITLSTAANLHSLTIYYQ